MTTTRTTRGGVPDLRTPSQRIRDTRDAELALEWRRLLSLNSSASRVALKDYLKEKHGITRDETYYSALRHGRELIGEEVE